MNSDVAYVVMLIVAFGLAMRLVAGWIARRTEQQLRAENRSIGEFLKHKRYEIGE